MSASREPGAPGQPGLRERKKARTRAALREHALRLFREQGYDATTIEQIAEAAEVSPSTFFRYFPTKEDVVLQDDMDQLWMEAIRAQPPGLSPIAALRGALLTAFSAMTPQAAAALQESAGLMMTVPAVRARAMDEFGRTIGVIAATVAERSGRPPDDFAAQAFAGAVTGVALAAWLGAGGDLQAFARKFGEGLALLEAGLTL